MTVFHRRAALSLMAAFLFCCTMVSGASAEQAKDAGDFIQKLSDKVIAVVAEKGTNSVEVEKFSALFTPAIDSPEVSRFILGRYWRQATPDQQKEFISLFEQINVLIWSKRFNEYNGEILEISGSTKDNDRYIVDSSIKSPNGKSISVQWAVHLVGSSFKIVDITVEGVSMAITNRSDYASAIQSQGGKMDGLLDVMRKKVAALKAERGLP